MVSTRLSSRHTVFPRRKCGSQRGVALIIALVLLVILSLLGAMTMRNAASTERVSAALRMTELANQAAEIALRHCEESVVEVIRVAAGGTPTFTTTFTVGKVLPPDQMTLWQSPAVWDSNNTATYVLPLQLVNQASMRSTYRRPPECMVAPVPVALTGTSPSTTASFVITARGFGPDVPVADGNRSRPVGTEAWLQSHITLN